MKKLRVLVLVHDYMVPPKRVKGHDIYTVEWRTEYNVITTLKKKLKHDVHVLGVKDDLATIRQARDDFKPDIAFNLLEAFHEVGTYDGNVVSYLELLRMPYTGCNPRGMFLARDKALSKKLLHYHRIRVPEFAVIKRRRRITVPKRMTYPMIVKSLTEEASIGISQASVVDDETRMRERVQFIHESIGTDAIVEQFIDGRELYCGILGNERLKVLPVWELTFDNLPDSQHNIATERVKWSWKHQNKVGVDTGVAQDLSEEQMKRVQHISRRVYRILDMTGYGRIDLRVDNDGQIYVLEANPNPQIAQYEDFSLSANHVGITYPDLLQRILKLGLAWNPEHQG